MRTTKSTKPSGRRQLSLALVMTLVVTTVFAFAGSAQAQLKVSMMPSFTQNRAYANATINQSIDVWGRAWGGTAPYSYTLSFGDGTTDATGSGLSEAAASYQIVSSHTYTLGGSKTATLTVTDSLGAVASRSAVIRVIANPTHEEKVNMAIEKGLLWLYRNKTNSGATRVYWINNSTNGTGASGAALLAFGENGHLASNDYVEDIYAEMMQKGVNGITSRSRLINIGNQSSGNPDSNSNGTGLYVINEVYANAFAAMGVNIAFPSAAAAQAATIPAGENGQAPAGSSYYDYIVDSLDTMAWGQLDGGWKGWHYSFNSGGRDGSTHQWPNMALLLARDRWGFTVSNTVAPGNIPDWVINNSVSAFEQLQHVSTNQWDGGCGYGNLNHWVNSGKTGGLLVGYHLGGRAPGNTTVDRAITFLGKNWYSQTDTGTGAFGGNWPGEFYGMYAVKKGLSLHGVQNVTAPDGTVHDWYNDMCHWLLGDASGLNGNVAPSRRVRDNYAFGQRPDGSWQTTTWLSFWGRQQLDTSHAILVLTQAVTIPLPVAIVEPVSVQPRNFAFAMDGSNSFHQDNDLDIVLYEWDWDASDGLSWESGPADASGSSTPTNPGYALPGFYTVTLRVTDNNPEGANTDTATTVVEVTDQNAPPVAVPIPAGQPSYSGRIGEDITLDGSDSFDPEGDPIILYDWDLDGDGVFGDAFGPFPIVSFVAEYSGVIGLRVTSEDGDGIQKTSTNNTVIDIFASPSDLYVSAISAEIIVSGEEANVSATVNNAADSGKPFTGVVVRFYNGNPFAGGSLVGPAFSVDLPIGGSASIGPVNLTGLGGAEAVFVYVDANEAIGEYDENNNTASVNVSNNPPIAIAQDVTVSADADCLGTVTIDQINNESFDPDGDELTLSVSPVGPYPLGATEVTLTVSDGKETDTATATVTVVDDTPPVITCPDDIVVNNDPGECSAIVDYATPVATDNCPDPVTELTVGLASGSIFPVGTTTVTYLATDGAGNTAECSFTVTVIDNEAPTITCPADVCVVSDADSCDASDVLIGLPTTSDNCPGETAANDHPSSTYSLGDTVVTWTVTDAAGNTATCTQTITVLASVAVEWRPPLKGQPVGNKINVGQTLPHKVRLTDCTGVTMVSGITVTLRIQGVDGVTGAVLEDVIEDANGTGVDGTATSDGVMVLTDSQWHFNVDTGNFGETNTLASDNYYESTVTITDNATLKVLGTSSVILETKSRGKK